MNKDTHTLFDDIDSCDKAYFLGLVASSGVLTDKTITLQVHRKNEQTLECLKSVLWKSIKLKRHIFTNQVSLSIRSKALIKIICKHFNIQSPQDYALMMVPQQINTDKLILAFIRGIVDGVGTIYSPFEFSYPLCEVSVASAYILEFIHSYISIGHSKYLNRKLCANTLAWRDLNCLEFLGKLYTDTSYGYLQSHRNAYLDWSQFVSLPDKVKITRFKYGAIIPSKTNITDSGFDITIIDKIKTVGDVDFYGTGIKISPPFGWYFDLVPRSSISKSGYMLANSVGIVDRGYTGEIIVALRKIDAKADDLVLPAKIAQIIPRSIVHMEFEEIFELERTTRNIGGFGSTG